MITAALDASVQSALVTGTCTVLVALIGIALELLRRANKRIGRVQESAEAAREQVQNAHSATNLRDDLDRVLASQHRIEELLRQHHADIRGVRDEVRHERAERLDVERRLDAVIRNRPPGA